VTTETDLVAIGADSQFIWWRDFWYVSEGWIIQHYGL